MGLAPLKLMQKPISDGQVFFEKFQLFFSRICDPSKNHEKTCFRASLKPQGPRDPPCVKERKILFRIALTRALYDQMAPQLCPFYVPGKLRSFLFFFLKIEPLKKHEKRGARGV